MWCFKWQVGAGRFVILVERSSAAYLFMYGSLKVGCAGHCRLVPVRYEPITELMPSNDVAKS